MGYTTDPIPYGRVRRPQPTAVARQVAMRAEVAAQRRRRMIEATRGDRTRVTGYTRAPESGKA